MKWFDNKSVTLSLFWPVGGGGGGDDSFENFAVGIRLTNFELLV